MKWSERVSYQVGIKIDKNFKGIVIIDESDAISFDDFKAYYQNTKTKNIRVIGLTATAYTGSEDGLERQALELLKYQIYKTSNNQELLDPTIHQEMILGTAEAYKKFVERRKEVAPVVVYANGALHGALAESNYITPVSEQTTDEDLRKMDQKKNNSYPVYLISEGSGDRGLDYRAPQAKEGITMIIGGSFSDPRTKIQTLSRVGRYGDKCLRIKDTSFPLINHSKNSQRKGVISGVLSTISKEIEKANQK